MTCTCLTPYTALMLDDSSAAKEALFDAIDRRRQELGWTWADVARGAGMSRQLLHTLRQSPNPSIITTLRLLDVVGLTLVVAGKPGFDPTKPPQN